MVLFSIYNLTTESDLFLSLDVIAHSVQDLSGAIYNILKNLRILLFSFVPYFLQPTCILLTVRSILKTLSIIATGNIYLPPPSTFTIITDNSSATTDSSILSSKFNRILFAIVCISLLLLCHSKVLNITLETQIRFILFHWNISFRLSLHF